METTYLQNVGAVSDYSDIWRTGSPTDTVSTPDDSRSIGAQQLHMNPYSVCQLDLEPLGNAFTFGPCTPPYIDYTARKKESPYEVAGALLSLKHAVVPQHQLNEQLSPNQYSGQLSPLSPPLSNHHFSAQPPQVVSPQVMASSAGPSPTYTIGPHHGPVSANMYGGGSMPTQQFLSPPPPPPPSQYPGESSGHHQYVPSQPAEVFPSMSVNVSMSMNIGMPTNLAANPQYHPMSPHYQPHQQWTSPTPHPLTEYHHGNYGHAPYSPYSPPNRYNYGMTYSFNSEFRNFSERRGSFYRGSDVAKDNGGFSSYSNIKRVRVLPCRQNSMSPGNDSVKVNLCRICGKTYARPSTLKTHMRTHSGERPYQCSTCNKSFSQAANLTAHMRTHSGERPFRCPVCSRTFSQSSSVTTHMRTHSGERPYGCRVCKKAFSDSSTLTKHLRIHNGQKPYQCKLCLLRFSQSGNLNRHMRVHANNDNHTSD